MFCLPVLFALFLQSFSTEIDLLLQVFYLCPTKSHLHRMKAAAHIVEQTPDAELKMKLGETEIKGLLADFGGNIHLAKVNGHYVALI